MKKKIIIFGSTGNLMYKKLIPAFSNLKKNNLIDENTKIYLLARRDWNLSTYIEEAKKEINTPIDWDSLVPLFEYVNMDIKNIDDYLRLKDLLGDEESDRVFYLAVPPSLFPIIAKGISSSRLVEKGDLSSRIVFEKPFGENLTTAKEINNELWKYFDEKQIYRIDHYLGKEMIQNILVVRFANSIFDKAWDKESIESIIILAKEDEDVSKRGNYYDKIGALKDMVQSHLMQMVALITMDRPKSYNSDEIKNEKVKVIQNFKIGEKDMLIGQYKGYVNAPGIEKDSKTETFVYAKGFIDDNRWEGVPIYLLTGKALDEKRSEIIINFKHSESGLFDNSSNKLIIKVAPSEGVNFMFNVKEPGLSSKVVASTLDYCHACKYTGNTPEAYEKLLLDVINNQDQLFTRWDEIENSWRIIDEIKKHDNRLYIYENYDQLKKKIYELNGGEINDI
jgi:glucose-6-phosphate 1-dehydrogenase